MNFQTITARGVEGRVDDQLIRIGSHRLLSEAEIELGIHTLMITGENERTSRHLASQVGR